MATKTVIITSNAAITALGLTSNATQIVYAATPGVQSAYTLPADFPGTWSTLTVFGGGGGAYGASSGDGGNCSSSNIVAATGNMPFYVGLGGQPVNGTGRIGGYTWANSSSTLYASGGYYGAGSGTAASTTGNAGNYEGGSGQSATNAGGGGAASPNGNGSPGVNTAGGAAGPGGASGSNQSNLRGGGGGASRATGGYPGGGGGSNISSGGGAGGDGLIIGTYTPASLRRRLSSSCC